jgi:PAS domain S-box-containing protein
MNNFRKETKIEFALLIAFVLMGLSLVAVVNTGNFVLTGVRAYVAGEGQWSKAQKQASMYLIRYLELEQESDYRRFNEVLLVIDGDRAARETLQSENPDLNVARQGFLDGLNHPDDIDAMILMFQKFQNVSPMSDAIEIWEEGDKMIDSLRILGSDIREAVLQGEISEARRLFFYDSVYRMDENLTELENNFSGTMGDAARLVKVALYWSVLIGGFIFIILLGYLTIRLSKQFKSWQTKISLAELQFRRVVENSRDLIYQMNMRDGSYDYISPSVKDLLGYDPEEFMKGGSQFVLEKIHPDDVGMMKRELEKLFSNDSDEMIARDNEFRILTKDGTYKWLNDRRSLISNKDNQPIALIGNVMDVSERKEYEYTIDKSLKEKEILLQEIHHRVKNNLAIISSLIELQKDGLSDEMQEVFQETQTRIRSIALVHEKLYQSERLAEIDISEYVSELSRIITQTFTGKNKKIEFREDIDSIKISIVNAVPLGLLINELLSNSFKHAFNGAGDGIIRISFKKGPDKYVVSVEDNGAGLPEGFDINEQTSMGMTLVKTLTRQIQGTLNITSDEWTRFEITFPSADSKKRK